MSLDALLPVYRRSALTMVRGEGCYLFDDAGKRYLDFASGIAVNSLGHCHPHLVQALTAQAATLWHCSNIYRIPDAERLAARLVARSFAEKVFFCSSGTEAVESGIKILRKFHASQGQPQRFRIITFEGGFHGRTYGGISAGGNAVAREGFGPLLEGFDRVPFNDLAAVEAAIGPHTGGILLEPVQGEGGVRAADAAFLRGLRALSDQHGLLLFLDEVQCGMGRTGTLFTHEMYGVTPDICTVAKGIGSGFPLAACLVTARAGSGMTPGSHGSTYGANPLAMAVGNAVLDVMLQPEFLPNVQRVGARLLTQLEALVKRFPEQLRAARGQGLMLGLVTQGAPQKLAEALRRNGLLTAPASGDTVIRLLPPLILTETQAEEAISLLTHTLEHVHAEPA